MHSFEMPHFPSALTSSDSKPSYFLRQSRAHSRPSSRQSRRQRVVMRHVESCAQSFNSRPQLCRRHRKTARLSSLTFFPSRTRAHHPSEHGFHMCFLWCFHPASAGCATAAIKATMTSKNARALSFVLNIENVKFVFFRDARPCVEVK